MNPTKSFRLLIVCALAFGAGIWLGWDNKPGKHAMRTGTNASPVGKSASAASREAHIFETITAGDLRFGRLVTALKERTQLRQRHGLYEQLRDVALADLPALIERAEKLPWMYRDNLLAALLERWLELDKPGARAWIQARQVSGGILTAWARVDPEAALKDAFSGGTMRRWFPDAIQAAVEALAGPALRDQVARLAQLPANNLRDNALTQRLREWTGQDPEAAFQFAMGLPPGKLRDQARDQVLIKWAVKDPAAAITNARKVLPELTAGIAGSGLLTQITAGIAGKDPAAALKFASELPPEFRTYPSIAAAREWAKKDPAAALDWCQANGIDIAHGLRSDNGGGWTGAVLKEAMLNHPEATVAWVETLPAGAERDRLMERALLERVTNIPPEKLFKDQNECAMQLFDQLTPEAKLRAAAQIGNSLAGRRDLDDLRTITALFSDEPSQLRAVSAALQDIGWENAAKAEKLFADFTKNLPPGPAYDAATSGLAIGIRQSADIALTRAMNISDPALLRSTIDSIMCDWIQFKPREAQKWLSQAQSFPADWVKTWQAKVATK
jgi:hypothetical protein